jgi:hypothetical protein
MATEAQALPSKLQDRTGAAGTHPDLRTYRERSLAPRRYPRTSNSKKFSLSLQQTAEASHFILKWSARFAAVFSRTP